MIEKGRHRIPSIPREQRTCPTCPTEVENEMHFLTKCSAYNRFHLFEGVAIQTPNFRALDNDQQFVFLMSQEDKDITFTLAHCTFHWFKLRQEIENVNDLNR